MADERVRAVGDLEKAYKDLNKEFENSKNVVAEIRTELNNLEETYKVIASSAKELKDDLSSDPKTLADLKKQADLRAKINSNINNSIKVKQEEAKLNKILVQKEKESEALLQKKLRTETQLAREQERIRVQNRKIAKEKSQDLKSEKRDREALAREHQKAINNSIKSRKALINEKSAFKGLERQVNSAEARFKRLAAQYGINSKQARKAAGTFKLLDDRLRKINEEARNGKRDVGRYGKAWESARATILRVGAGIGIVSTVRESIEVLEEFDEKVADIRKTTGLEDKDARLISEDLFKIDTKTSITNLQELVEAGGRLGITGVANLKGFAEAADKVFVALGDDLEGSADEISTNLGKIASNFGLEAEFGIAEAIEKVGSGINTLSAESKAGAPAILDFTNRMAGFSEVLKLSDVQALGAFFDEGGQSIEVASTTLNKLLPSLANNFEKFSSIAGKTPEEFKKIAEEAPIEALKLVASGAKNNEKGLFNLTKILESYGVESARATSIVGLLTNKTERLTELQEINAKAIDDNLSITEEFNTKNDTLSATFSKATKKFQEYIIEFDKSAGVTLRLKNALKFLAENLGTIVSVGGKLLTFFVIYQTRIKVLNALNGKFGKSLKKVVSGFKEMTKGGKGAISGLKNIGKALKGIGFSVAIELVLEMASAFWDMASGAAQAREDLARLDKQIEIGNEKAISRIESIEKRRKKVIDDARLALSKEEITQKQFDAILKSSSKAKEEDFQKEIEQALSRRRVYKEQIAFLEKIKVTNGQALPRTDQLKEFEEITKRLGVFQENFLGNISAESVYDGVAQLEANIKGVNTQLPQYSKALDDAKDASFELSIEQNETNKSTANGGKEAKKAAKSYKDLADQLKSVSDIEKERQELIDDSLLEGIEKSQESELQSAVDLANKKGEIRTDAYMSYIDKEDKLRQEMIERQYEEEIQAAVDLGGSREEVQERFKLAETRRNIELQKLENDIVQKKKDGLKEIELAQEDYDSRRIEAERAAQEELDRLEEERIEREKQQLKERADNRDKWIKAGLEAYEAFNEKQIEATERVAEADKRLKDEIQANAERGILENDQSIALQEEKIQAANAEKIRLEKQKQAVEFATSAILAFNNALGEGKTVPQALGEASLSAGALQLILGSLPKFFHGAEDTGSVGMFSDQYGAVTGVTHANERVINAEGNKKLKGMSNESVVDLVTKYAPVENGEGLTPEMINQLSVQQALQTPQIKQYHFNDDRMIKKLDAVNDSNERIEKAIKSIVFPENDTAKMGHELIAFIHKDRYGNEKHYVNSRKDGGSRLGRTKA